MKKILPLFLALMMVLALVSCGGAGDTTEADGKDTTETQVEETTEAQVVTNDNLQGDWYAFKSVSSVSTVEGSILEDCNADEVYVVFVYTFDGQGNVAVSTYIDTESVAAQAEAMAANEELLAAYGAADASELATMIETALASLNSTATSTYEITGDMEVTVGQTQPLVFSDLANFTLDNGKIVLEFAKN